MQQIFCVGFTTRDMKHKLFSFPPHDVTGTGYGIYRMGPEEFPTCVTRKAGDAHLSKAPGPAFST